MCEFEGVQWDEKFLYKQAVELSEDFMTLKHGVKKGFHFGKRIFFWKFFLGCFRTHVYQGYGTVATTVTDTWFEKDSGQHTFKVQINGD